METSRRLSSINDENAVPTGKVSSVKKSTSSGPFSPVVANGRSSVGSLPADLFDGSPAASPFGARPMRSKADRMTVSPSTMEQLRSALNGSDISEFDGTETTGLSGLERSGMEDAAPAPTPTSAAKAPAAPTQDLLHLASPAPPALDLSFPFAGAGAGADADRRVSYVSPSMAALFGGPPSAAKQPAEEQQQQLQTSAMQAGVPAMPSFDAGAADFSTASPQPAPAAEEAPATGAAAVETSFAAEASSSMASTRGPAHRVKTPARSCLASARKDTTGGASSLLRSSRRTEGRPSRVIFGSPQAAEYVIDSVVAHSVKPMEKSAIRARFSLGPDPEIPFELPEADEEGAPSDADALADAEGFAAAPATAAAAVVAYNDDDAGSVESTESLETASNSMILAEWEQAASSLESSVVRNKRAREASRSRSTSSASQSPRSPAIDLGAEDSDGVSSHAASDADTDEEAAAAHRSRSRIEAGEEEEAEEEEQDYDQQPSSPKRARRSSLMGRRSPQDNAEMAAAVAAVQEEEEAAAEAAPITSITAATATTTSFSVGSSSAAGDMSIFELESVGSSSTSLTSDEAPSVRIAPPTPMRRSQRSASKASDASPTSAPKPPRAPAAATATPAAPSPAPAPAAAASPRRSPRVSPAPAPVAPPAPAPAASASAADSALADVASVRQAYTASTNYKSVSPGPQHGKSKAVTGLLAGGAAAAASRRRVTLAAFPTAAAPMPPRARPAAAASAAAPITAAEALVEDMDQEEELQEEDVDMSVAGPPASALPPAPPAFTVAADFGTASAISMAASRASLAASTASFDAGDRTADTADLRAFADALASSRIEGGEDDMSFVGATAATARGGQRVQDHDLTSMLGPVPSAFPSATAAWRSAGGAVPGGAGILSAAGFGGFSSGEVTVPPPASLQSLVNSEQKKAPAMRGFFASEEVTTSLPTSLAALMAGEAERSFAGDKSGSAQGADMTRDLGSLSGLLKEEGSGVPHYPATSITAALGTSFDFAPGMGAGHGGDDDSDDDYVSVAVMPRNADAGSIVGASPVASVAPSSAESARYSYRSAVNTSSISMAMDADDEADGAAAAPAAAVAVAVAPAAMRGKMVDSATNTSLAVPSPAAFAAAAPAVPTPGRRTAAALDSALASIKEGKPLTPTATAAMATIAGGVQAPAQLTFDDFCTIAGLRFLTATTAAAGNDGDGEGLSGSFFGADDDAKDAAAANTSMSDVFDAPKPRATAAAKDRRRSNMAALARKSMAFRAGGVAKEAVVASLVTNYLLMPEKAQIEACIAMLKEQVAATAPALAASVAALDANPPALFAEVARANALVHAFDLEGAAAGIEPAALAAAEGMLDKVKSMVAAHEAAARTLYLSWRKAIVEQRLGQLAEAQAALTDRLLTLQTADAQLQAMYNAMKATRQQIESTTAAATQLAALASPLQQTVAAVETARSQQASLSSGVNALEAEAAALSARRSELHARIAEQRAAVAALEAEAAAASDAAAARSAEARAVAAADAAAAKYKQLCASTGWTIADGVATPSNGAAFIFNHGDGSSHELRVTFTASGASPVPVPHFHGLAYTATAALPAAWKGAGIADFYAYAVQSCASSFAEGAAAGIGSDGADLHGSLQALTSSFRRIAALCSEVARLKNAYSVRFSATDGTFASSAAAPVSKDWAVVADLGLPAKKIKFRLSLALLSLDAYPAAPMPVSVIWVAGGQEKAAEMGDAVRRAQVAFAATASRAVGADGALAAVLQAATTLMKTW